MYKNLKIYNFCYARYSDTTTVFFFCNPTCTLSVLLYRAFFDLLSPCLVNVSVLLSDGEVFLEAPYSIGSLLESIVTHMKRLCCSTHSYILFLVCNDSIFYWKCYIFSRILNSSWNWLIRINIRPAQVYLHHFKKKCFLIYKLDTQYQSTRVDFHVCCFQNSVLERFRRHLNLLLLE